MLKEARGDVLVIEDDPEINALVCAYVELAGCNRRCALTGNEGLQKARERVPALVVLDLMLPDVEGLEVCRQLRSEEATREVPVVILTALHQDEVRERARQIGASEYLTKPFDPDQLISTVRAYAGV